MYCLKILEARNLIANPGGAFHFFFFFWLVGGCPLPVSSCGPLFVRFCIPVSPSYKDTSQTGLGLTLMISFNLIHLCKDPVSQHCHILKYYKLGFQYMNLGSTRFNP